MSNSVFQNESNQSVSAHLGKDGSPHTPTPKNNSLSKALLSVGAMLSVILLCGLGLRISVGMISEQSRVSTDVTASPVSRSKAERLTERQLENERIREEARRKDRELLDRRRERLWREQCVDRPDKTAAYQIWYREVEEIEQQLKVAEEIQATLRPEDANHGPLAEGTVLWHRKQRLMELKADAPRH
ncbi:hypothetical protein [Aporhodopirellula aestuarii]|uniref:Uncharacterized protein n=1 Tax=Aporhodopirellula aestuarii TaxID=2950107 RepID=A0ABT0U7U3_9BACT|nr:hypothetical protein [Aporhodopirellula aestuarii]MCM2372431.1 hypothetical protein [Aporhodopirellula aestuarii]